MKKSIHVRMKDAYNALVHENRKEYEDKIDSENDFLKSVSTLDGL